MTEEMAYLSATELARLYGAGELSPVEVARAALERVDGYDRDLNAFCFVDADATVKEALASERRWRSQEPLGAIDGVPVAVKDVFLTAGWPTLRGSRTVPPEGPWHEDAPAVARLRERGCVLLGKTTIPELGWKAVTDSPLAGVTRNPWDRAVTPGGSSGGSGAALAAGMAPLALGSDGGGSIRIPASFCGVVGFKPTFGRVPLWPPSAYGRLSHAGPMARSVEDAALLLDVMSGADARDTSSLPPPRESYAGHVESLAEAAAVLDGLAVAYCPGWGTRADPQVAAAAGRAARLLDGLGARVEEVPPPFADPLGAFSVLWDAAAASVLAPLGEDARALLDPGLARAGERGAALSALDYLEALAERESVAQACARLAERFPLLVTPAVPVLPFAAGRDVPEGWPEPDWPTWTPLTYPFNMTQQPAVVLPCGLSEGGLPIGLQIVGPRHGDGLVLAAARALEEALEMGGVRPAL